MKAIEPAELARYWESNAHARAVLARMGYDIYRDSLNTPAFLEFLPDVTGIHGLDIGCGEGSNTRLLADRGARMTAIDISPTFYNLPASGKRNPAWTFWRPTRPTCRFVPASLLS
jgi:2-polyprenyl-3-methyl-5-hydroxy-6-metoxy-1,4-benzoquinol methylase